MAQLEGSPSRIAVIADLLEEKWPSMDLAAEQLAAHLSELGDVEGVLVRPPLRLTRRGRSPSAVERALGRFIQLPIELKATRFDADYFHIADHSYGHVSLLFPRDRLSRHRRLPSPPPGLRRAQVARGAVPAPVARVAARASRISQHVECA
jgi:hypothetical protein